MERSATLEVAGRTSQFNLKADANFTLRFMKRFSGSEYTTETTFQICSFHLKHVSVSLSLSVQCNVINVYK
jgi:hypothetical protein